MKTIKDLIAIIYQKRLDGSSDEEIKKSISKEVYSEMKQMTEKEFHSCFASASFVKENNEIEIILRINPTSN